MNNQTRTEAVGFPMTAPAAEFVLDPAAGGVLRARSLLSFPWLAHGFGTRLAAVWPPSGDPVATLRQIHSTSVVVVEDPAAGVLGEGDGLVTGGAGAWLAVRTADCASVILADPVHRAAAVVHAGWRGAVGQIVPAALERMAERYGTGSAGIWAAIGPAIGLCCFEVGPEVAAQFAPWWPERDDLRGKARVDLAGTIMRQLTKAGVPESHVTRHGGCTRCDESLFHSFRRDGDRSGRMVTAAAIIGPQKQERREA